MEFVEGADLALIGRHLKHTWSLKLAVAEAWAYLLRKHEDLPLPTEAATRRDETVVPGPAGSLGRELARFFRRPGEGTPAPPISTGSFTGNLSPANVMATHPDVRAIVMDLGLASINSTTRAATTERSTMAGTLRYVAPEQLQKNLASVDHRADIYSLGVILYELLCGQPFFDGDNEPRLMEQILHETPLPLEKVDSSIPRDLSRIVAKATEKLPRMRYESADNLAADLDAFLEGRPISVRPPSIGYLLQLSYARHRALFLTAAAALVLVLASTTVFILSLQKEITARKKLQHHTEQLERTSVALYEHLVKQEAELWPAVEERIPAMRSWMDEVESVQEWYTAALADVSTVATSRVGGDRESLRARFDHLSQLKSRVLSRMSDAETLRKRSVEDHAEAWNEAIAAIASSESYGELKIAPQVGLVPLEENAASGLWEFWLVGSGRRPHRKRGDHLSVGPGDGMILVLIPGQSSYCLGSEDTRQDQYKRTCKPVLLHPYFISKYETTQDQWMTVMEANPSNMRAGYYRDLRRLPGRRRLPLHWGSSGGNGHLGPECGLLQEVWRDASYRGSVGVCVPRGERHDLLVRQQSR